MHRQRSAAMLKQLNEAHPFPRASVQVSFVQGDAHVVRGAGGEHGDTRRADPLLAVERERDVEPGPRVGDVRDHGAVELKVLAVDGRWAGQLGAVHSRGEVDARRPGSAPARRSTLVGNTD